MPKLRNSKSQQQFLIINKFNSSLFWKLVLIFRSSIMRLLYLNNLSISESTFDILTNISWTEVKKLHSSSLFKHPFPNKYICNQVYLLGTIYNHACLQEIESFQTLHHDKMCFTFLSKAHLKTPAYTEKLNN